MRAILLDHQDIPQSQKLDYCYFHSALQDVLQESGFLNAAREVDPLAAALLVAEAAKIPPVVEVGASALIAPALMPDEVPEGPIAYVDGARLDKPHRNLAVAKTAFVNLGEDVAVVSIDEGDVERVETIYAYPFGKFVRKPDLTRSVIASAGATATQWARVALAAEFAGAAQAAIDFTVDYVKQRTVFGRPVGSFQAVQHRLVQCSRLAKGAYYLAMKAAWSKAPEDAMVAACYVQSEVQKLMYDLHQFNGAMGVTTEHLLHFWTYRLRALQSETGGAHGAALDIADSRWGAAGDNGRREC